MTYSVFLQLLLAVMGLMGLAFLYLFFKDGIPGRQLPLPGALRTLFAIALTGSPIASVLYAVLAGYRIFSGTWVYPADYNVRVQQVMLVCIVLLPTAAKLVTLLYIRHQTKGQANAGISK